MSTITPSASDQLYRQNTGDHQPTEQSASATETASAPTAAAAPTATTIPLPQDGKWSPEALQALGVPEKPEGYALTRPQLPEGLPYDESFETEMRGAAHQLGIAPWQLQGLLDRYADYAGRQFGDIAKVSEETRASAETELKRDWGRDYDAKLAFARRTVATFGGEQAIADLNSSGLGNHPALIRMLAAIGETMGEDSLVQGDRGGGRERRDPATVLYG